MNLFDKICGGLAFVLGLIFLVLGAAGLFLGSSAHFTLPPLLGVAPAFVGWGIVRAVYIAWNAPTQSPPTDDYYEYGDASPPRYDR